MITYNNSVSLRNDGLDSTTGKQDLNAGTGVLVTVRVATVPSGQGALADLLDINDNPLPNPVTTDNNGNYFFKADSGNYDIIALEGSPNEQILPSVSIGVGGSISSSVETLDLADGQDTVTFSANVRGAGFVLNGDNVDSGRLLAGLDFTFGANPTDIILTDTYPLGTSISALKADFGGDTSNEKVVALETLASAQQYPQAKLGMAFNVKERTTGNGGGGMWDCVDINSVTVNGFDIVACVGIPALALVLRIDTVIHTAKLGSVHNGNDITAVTQRAMDLANANRIDTVIMPNGIGYLSIAESVSTTTCLEIPANVNLKGMGRGNTTLRRLPAERGVDGVLICNRNYDTVGAYGAEGNSSLSCFTIGDGGVAPARSLGDLIGLGHARNIKIHDMHFEDHDQHAIDICSCSNIEIYRNTGLNKAGTSGSSATIQIDNAFGIGIYGLFISVPSGGGTYAEPTEMIDIHSNDLENEISPCIELCHGQWGRYKGINIHDNYRFSGGFITGQSVIKLDDDVQWVHLEGLKIVNNGIQGNSSGAKLINLFNYKGLSTFSNINVHGNYGVTKDASANGYTGTNNFQTLGDTAIYIGNSAAFVPNGGSTEPSFKDISVKDNNFILTGTSVNMRPYTIYNCSGVFKDNYCKINIDAKVNQPLILIDTPRGLEVSGNTTESLTQSGSIGAASAAMQLLKSLDYDSEADIHHNSLTGDSMAFNFNQIANGNWASTESNIKFHDNKFDGAVPAVTIHEETSCSDGTNGWHQVDLGSTDGALSLAIATTYQYNVGMIKKGGKSKTKFETQFASQFANFATDNEELQTAYISPTQWVGTTIALIKQNTGGFDIRTGTDGVSVVTNNATGQPVLRTVGGLKVWAGI